MFDRIGVTVDAEARRREAASLFVTVAGTVAVVGFWTAWATWTLVAPAPPAPEPLELVLVEPPALEDERPLPALPAAPAPAAAPAKGEEAAAPPPDEPSEPQPLADDPPDAVAPSAGSPQGTSDGAPDGTGTGPGPSGTGTGPGPGGGGRRAVHPSELEWKKRPDPAWPAEATRMGLTGGTCVASVWFDAQGVPVEVSFRDCPGVFQRGARSAILRSRVEPFETGGERISVETTIRIRYVLEE